MLDYLKKKRQVFYSFEYKPDVFRVQQVLKMGVVEGEQLLLPNAWEEVRKGGHQAIVKWIDENMKNKSCVIVLVGNNTTNRPLVQYEIEKGWNDGKGILGIHIHNLECVNNGYCEKGSNPFKQFILSDDKIRKDRKDAMSSILKIYKTTRILSDVVKCYDPVINPLLRMLNPEMTTGKIAYRYIEDHIKEWVEEAITIRNNYKNDLFWPFG